MEKRLSSACALGVAALLLAGCGEEAPKQSAAPMEQKKEMVESAPVVENKSATEKAKEAMTEASSSVKQAAETVAEKVSEKAADAKESMTEATASMVEKTADKVTEMAAAVETAVAPDKAAEKTYKSLCFSCHDNGIAGAPKLGDQAVWAPRIAAGMDTLYATAINGKGAMPPKGGNVSLSDEAVKAAVDYMVAQAQ
ncbi:MAG: c-type cytochrome [Motiliproteus sp.]|nr:c-type cytochrome [Motiliproteus sp.]MCW9052682.1 c-type cytochrome [Motiliproteus sp.]